MFVLIPPYKTDPCSTNLADHLEHMKMFHSSWILGEDGIKETCVGPQGLCCLSDCLLHENPISEENEQVE